MKFNEIKKIPAFELLEIMQTIVKSNIQIIAANNELAADILQKDLYDEQRKASNLYNKNIKLLKTNNQYLELHAQLLRFMKMLSNEAFEYPREINHDINVSLENKTHIFKDIRFDDCFDLTITNKLEYNENHPFFGDDVFKEKLKAYYIEKEEYEKCGKLCN